MGYSDARGGGIGERGEEEIDFGGDGGDFAEDGEREHGLLLWK
jgi:hypothetical protein